MSGYFRYCIELILGKVYEILYTTTKEFETKRYAFNNSINSLMELVDYLEENIIYLNNQEKEVLVDILIKLLSLFVPHIAEELWSIFGKEGSIFVSKWLSVGYEILSRN